MRVLNNYRRRRNGRKQQSIHFRVVVYNKLFSSNDSCLELARDSRGWKLKWILEGKIREWSASSRLKERKRERERERERR